MRTHNAASSARSQSVTGSLPSVRTPLGVSAPWICGPPRLAAFTSDRNSRGSMHLGPAVVHGENVFEVRFVRKDVDHPGEHIGVEVSPFGFAGLFGVYGAEHAELGMSGLVVPHAFFRSPADVDVPMPARDAERDALVQLIFGCVGVCRITHDL